MTITEPSPLKIAPDSELGLRLKDAAHTGRPVVVDTGEAVYVVEVATETAQPSMEVVPAPTAVTPERVARSIEGIRKAAGAWQGLVDAEAFKAYIRERRRTKNRPSVRW
jgi:hypothetical protein